MRDMQPLSYQILPYSCWVTSMLNGLLLLYRDKNRMSGLVYKILHSLLTDEGVYTQGRQRHDWITVMEAIQTRTGLRVRVYMGAEVEGAVRKLNFKKQVAVCDILSGGHSILLTGKAEGWIEAFDPDWHNVKARRNKQNAYIVQPEAIGAYRRGLVNVLVDEDYLLMTGRGRKGEFQMGAVASRTLTVMEKR